MIHLLRRLSSTWIGFELVAFGVGYLLCKALPPADSIGPVLLGSLLGGTLLGIPLGFWLGGLLPAWPEHVPHWRRVAFGTIIGALVGIVLLQITNPKLVTLLATPLIMIPLEFAALIVRRLSRT